jgi:hypothetical protein
MSRIWKAGAIAAVGAVIVAGLVVVTSGDDRKAKGRRLEGDRPLQPTANPAPLRGKAGPNLAVNPADENHVVELHQELATGECEFNTSFDRGRTWTGGLLQAPGPRPADGPCPTTGQAVASIGQQSIAFGSGRAVYISWASTPDPNGSGSTVLLSRSDDGGATFSPGVPIAGLLGGPPPRPDFIRPELVVDRRPAADRLYITTRDVVGDQALVVRSDDAGATWGPPVQIAPSDPRLTPAPTFAPGATAPTTAGNAYTRFTELSQPVLGPAPPGGGERPLHVAGVALNRGAACPPACEVLGESPVDAYLTVASSSDAGLTWTRTRAVNVRGFRPPGGGTFRGSAFPRMAAGAGGALFLVFNQGPGAPGSTNCGAGPYPTGAPGASTRPCPPYRGQLAFESSDHSISYDADVWFIRSTDGGVTWGDLRQVNDGKRPGLAVPEITQTRHPQVAVAPSGRVDVVWEDRRHWYLSPSARLGAVTPSGEGLARYRCVHTHAACEEARLGDTYHAGSADGGVTFSPNRRVNDRSHNNDLGYDFRISTYRDYGPMAAALGATRLLVADMDSRLASPVTNSLDIFLREVDLAPPAGPLPVDDLGAAGAPALSVALSRHTLPGGAEAVLAGEAANRFATSVVIVNEGDATAALVGGVLARATLGVVLASPARGLPEAVRAEVDRLDPGVAYILGDATKLTPQVQTDLAAAGVPTDRVSRISGVAPADLAAAVARTLDIRSAAEKAAAPPLPAFDAAVIVNPSSPAAAAASALAASRRLPILLTAAGSLPRATAEVLAALAVTRTLVVGSAEEISPAVEAALPDPVRLAGRDPYADPYATSAAVVRESVARGLPSNIAYVADGAEPMHGALLGAAVARLGGLLLLVPGGAAAEAEALLGTLDLRAGTTRIVVSDLTGTAAEATRPGR